MLLQKVNVNGRKIHNPNFMTVDLLQIIHAFTPVDEKITNK